MLDRVRLLACDYDRTLTTPDLHLEEATLAALAEARAAGLTIVVVSGRGADFLRKAVGEAADLLIAENGAFLVEAATGATTRLFQSWPTEALPRLGVDLEVGLASASCAYEDAAALAAAVARDRLPVRLERNRDRMMIVPRGVDKGAGLVAVRARLGIERARVVAIGDGENDLALLKEAGWRVAVANAVDAVKAAADEVTGSPGGAGVREWIRDRLLPRGSAAAPRRPEGPARRG